MQNNNNNNNNNNGASGASMSLGQAYLAYSLVCGGLFGISSFKKYYIDQQKSAGESLVSSFIVGTATMLLWPAVIPLAAVLKLTGSLPSDADDKEKEKK